MKYSIKEMETSNLHSQYVITINDKAIYWWAKKRFNRFTTTNFWETRDYKVGLPVKQWEIDHSHFFNQVLRVFGHGTVDERDDDSIDEFMEWAYMHFGDDANELLRINRILNKVILEMRDEAFEDLSVEAPKPILPF